MRGKMNGSLYLIPCTLGESGNDKVLPVHVMNIAKKLKYFAVEHPKTARHFLGSLGLPHPIQEVDMKVLDKHTPQSELVKIIEPIYHGHDIGILSEAGCPGIADPGSDLVRWAQKKNIKVVPLVGPSSILLALMASGLNGQSFTFHGYLSANEEKRKIDIQELEKESIARNQTQLFIETPYRNQKMFKTLINVCNEQTLLCLATDITLETEEIKTKTIGQWKKETEPELNKRPTIFLLHSKQ